MRYRFSNFEMDTDRLEFRTKGEVQPLEPQVFDILRHLVKNADRLVSRDELIAAVWDGRIVSDATIGARINAVRKAVGDDGKRQRVVKTVPRRGFRFVAEVDVNPAILDSVASAPGVDRDFMGRPAVAVLPFANLSGDPEQEYFVDGLTEDIITTLSLWRSFPVIARQSTLF